MVAKVCGSAEDFREGGRNSLSLQGWQGVPEHYLEYGGEPLPGDASAERTRADLSPGFVSKFPLSQVVGW